MYSKLYSFVLCGIECHTVSVEVDSMNSIPSFDIVGLPDTAVKEARDRVRHAIKKVRGEDFDVLCDTINTVGFGVIDASDLLSAASVA